MILDTSAIVALLKREEEAPAMEAALIHAPTLAVSAATLVETAMVVEGRDQRFGATDLDDLLALLAPEIVPFTAEHAVIAREGWRRFGKGRHSAALNLGDCFAYALARARGEPLLFKGDDFARTDVVPALPARG